MRCPHCREENPPGAKFCLDCGKRLPTACAACEGLLPEGAKFCVACGTAVGAVAMVPGARAPQSYTPPHLAEKILATRTAIEGERKPVTVLFCDMVSSTALAEQLGPEGMHALLNRFFETALPEVHRYEGTINQFLGDGFMALFGAPIAHEDHARRAVLAALDIRRTVTERPLPLEPGRSVSVSLRFGVHTGFVVVGAIGDNLRMDYTAVGDTTHLAARLQQLAEPGAIVVSEATSRLVQGYVRLESRGAVEVRGRSSPVSIYLVTGPGTRRSPLEGLDAPALSHFVGRDRELGILRDLFGEVETGRGQAVAIVGEPGVGKSRLLLEFRRGLSGRRLGYIEGRCVSFGAAIPYGPVLDLVRSSLGLADADSPETVGEKVRGGLAEAGLDAASEAFVLQLLGIKDPSDRLAALGPEAIKVRTFDVLRQMSLRASRSRPLVIAVEDLHWVDRTSEDYLAFLVERLAGASIMLLVTYRPGYRPPWMEKSYVTQLSLTRLTAGDSLTVVRSVLPEAGLGDPLARLILDKAEGNPFFLEELARAVGDRSLARPGLTVPDTVHGVLTARIDRLADLPKRVLQTAAILGREFPLRLLEAVWDGLLDPHLRELTRQEFLYERSGPEDATYVFKHALTQDVAEATILAPRRRELHLRAAEALGALYPDRLPELSPLQAHHYFQAEAWPLACEHATRAAEAAIAAYANREALERYDQALTAGERASRPAVERMRLRAARGQVHRLLGAFDAASADLEAALALARESGDGGASAEMLGMLGELWGGHRDYQRGLELTREAVRTAEAAGDLRALADSLVRTGLMQVNVARITESQQQLERALAIFQDLGDWRGYAKTLDILGMADGIAGRIQRCLVRTRESLARFRALGDRTVESSIPTNLGFWLAFAGERATAEPLILQGLEAASDLGARSDQAYAHMALGWLLDLYGDYGRAWRESLTALDLAREIAHREWIAAALSTVGRIARVCGDPARARQLHEEMLATTHELGAVIWMASALGELGQDLLALGEEEAGLARLVEAVATAGEAAEFVVPPLLAESEFRLRQNRAELALDLARRGETAAPEYLVWAIDARALQGQALIGVGRLDEGERVLRAAKTEAAAIGARPPLWRASLALADLWTRHGRVEEAAAERLEARAQLEAAAAELPDDLRRSFADTLPMRRARGG